MTSASRPTKEPAPDAAPADAGAPSLVKKLLLPMLAVVGLCAGVGAGFVVGPRVAALRSAPRPAASEAAAAEEGGGGKEGEVAADRYYRLENLVVNPSGSLGSRFLLVTVVFDIPKAEQRTRLSARDAEVRDRVTATIASQTLEALGAPRARDSLKVLLAAAVAPLLDAGTAVRIYFPQYVIQ
jgi:flagellar protein FliL